jgi:hypothetical protein
MQHAFIDNPQKSIFDRDGFLHKTLVVDHQLSLSELSKNEFFAKFEVEEGTQHQAMLDRIGGETGRRAVGRISRSSSPRLRFEEAVLEPLNTRESPLLLDRESVVGEEYMLPEIKVAVDKKITASMGTQTIDVMDATPGTPPNCGKARVDTGIERETQTAAEEYVSRATWPV